MQFYGATEAGGAFSILRPDEHDLEDEAKLQSCGRPLPLIEFRIVDPAGNEVPDGEPGELVVRAPAITPGYWKQEEATAKVLQNGWYRTGDVARRDAEGLYYIVDRVKDMIVSGGENIYPAELENVLAAHPAVAEVAVIGTPHPEWGETPCAYAVPRWEGPSEAELIAYTRTRLARYKCPTSVVFVPVLPRNATGKLNKGELRRIDRVRSGQE
jgi:acyl-CoA synthetase (AMP-forming)/AMP-acid ligase II